MSRYCITVKELHRKIFQKLDQHSFDLILRRPFISKLNAMPQDTRSMYFNRMISMMQENEAQFDYFTGSEQSQYQKAIDLQNLDELSNCDEQQGEAVLNAIFNYTDTDNSALVQDIELYEMLEAFDFEETIDIAIGLGIDIPVANENVNNIIDQNASQIIDTSQETKRKQQELAQKEKESEESKRVKQEYSNALKKQKIKEMKLKEAQQKQLESTQNNEEKEYKSFMRTMQEKQKLSEHNINKAVKLSSQGVTLNTINTDIQVLQQRKAEREGKKFKSYYSFLNKQPDHSSIKTGIFLGLLALLLATQIMYERSNATKHHNRISSKAIS